MTSSEEWWSEKTVSSIDDEQMSMSWGSWQQIKETSDWWDDVTVSFNLKSKLVLLLRLWYLKPFLAGSKKTRQGPGYRVGALHISRCWFYLTIVTEPKLIQKRLQNYMVLCSFVLWFLMIQMFMICEWWSEGCLWNDYEMGRRNWYLIVTS